MTIAKTTMDKKLIRAYLRNETKIKTLEALRNSMRESIKEEMEAHNFQKVQSDYGTFSIGSKSTWKYSDSIKAEIEKLKVKKMKEEKSGIAEETVSTFLRFQEKK